MENFLANSPFLHIQQHSDSGYLVKMNPILTPYTLLALLFSSLHLSEIICLFTYDTCSIMITN